MNNIRSLSLILSIIVLSACSTTHTVATPVPVSCPAPHIPLEPHYPITDLKPSDASKPSVVVKACAGTIVAQRDYIQQLKALLEIYK